MHSGQTDSLPFTLTVTDVTPRTLPAHLDPFTYPSPSGAWRDFPVSTVVMDGEFWLLYKNGYADKVIRYKGARIEDVARQPDGKLNPTHSRFGTVVHPYLLGGMWYDAQERTLYAPVHCEYAPPTQGAGVVLRQVHLAVSTDKGLTWRYEGPLLTGDPAAAPYANSGGYWDGGDGDFYLYVDEPDGYVYLFTTYYLWPKVGVTAPYFMRHRVARCRMADKMASGAWQRFYNGGWNEPGIHGKASYVEAHRVVYSTWLKKYISFDYGNGLSMCGDLAKQDWSPSFKIPGAYWGTQKNLETTPMAPDGVSTWAFDRELMLYTYLQGWNAGPAHVYRVALGPGETTHAAGYLGWGVGADVKKFWDPDWEGPPTTDPLRPYGAPCYDSTDPIESRRVRKVACADPETQYAGAWAEQDKPVHCRASGAAGDSITLAFRGTGIFWRAAQGPDCGKADVFLDGQLQKTVDCGGAHSPWKLWFVRTGLDASAPHAIKVVVRGEKGARSGGTTIRHVGFECAGECNQASDGFSSVMGKNDWRYLAVSESGAANLDFDHVANGWHKGDVKVGHDFMQAGTGSDAVRRWVAPRTGTIRVEGTALVGETEGRCDAGILKGAERLWSAQLRGPAKPASAHDLTVAVRTGEEISFIAHRPDAAEGRGEQPAPAVLQWDPVITFEQTGRRESSPWSFTEAAGR